MYVSGTRTKCFEGKRGDSDANQYHILGRAAERYFSNWNRSNVGERCGGQVHATDQEERGRDDTVLFLVGFGLVVEMEDPGGDAGAGNDRDNLDRHRDEVEGTVVFGRQIVGVDGAA